MAMWEDESHCRDELGALLKPYFQRGETFDRAVLLSLTLGRRVHLSLTRRLGGKQHEELFCRFQERVWERRHEFDLDRGTGNFQVWAYHQLRACWTDLRRESWKHRTEPVSCEELPDIKANTSDLNPAEAAACSKEIIAKLYARFPRRNVDIYLMRFTETPRPTLREIADRVNMHPEAGLKTRESAVNRILEDIKRYIESTF